MNFERLRALVLERAVQGNLVSQLESEPETAQLGDAPQQFPIEIPEKWKWVKLSELATEMADGPFGSNLKKEHYTLNREARIIQLSNIGEHGWRNENVKYTTFEHAETISRSKVNSGDIVIAKMMPAGRAIIVPPIEKTFVLSSDAVKVVVNNKYCLTKYLNFAINSNVFKNQVYSNVQGTTRIRTSVTKLKNYYIPLPSLEEQIRIVAKLEEAFDEIDRAEKAYEELQTLAGVLRGQILQEAIQGKLVPQLVSDGVTKQIAEAPEEVPFDIPNTWSWIRGEELAVKRKTIDPSTLTNDEIELWSIPAYDAGVAEKVSPGDIGSSKKVVQAGDVLLAKIVPHIERVWIVSESANSLMKLASTEWLVYASELFLPEFMGLLFRSPYFRTKMMESVSGMGSLKRANPRTLAKVWLPVPPIKEQERIVIKVETLLKQVNLLLTK